MSSRARVCDWCTARMRRDENRYIRFIDAGAEYSVCSEPCKKALKGSLKDPDSVVKTAKVARWSSRVYAARSSSLIGSFPSLYYPKYGYTKRGSGC